MNNFTQRALTGIVFVAVLSGCILYGSLSCSILFALIIVLGMNEFYTLVMRSEVKPQRFTGIAAGLFLFLSFVLPHHLPELSFRMIATSSMLLLFFIFIAELFRNSTKPFENMAYTILGIVYVSLPFSLLYESAFIRESYKAMIPMGYFFLLWTSDTGAYLSGMTFGRTKLFERISPKKTIEGSAGGFILSLVVAFLLSRYTNELTLMQWMILALIVVVTGTLGDLVESMLKRSIGIKDSGNLLPGHGGMLDRFDAVLVSAPFVYWYLSVCC